VYTGQYAVYTGQYAVYTRQYAVYTRQYAVYTRGRRFSSPTAISLLFRVIREGNLQKGESIDVWKVEEKAHR